VETYNIDGEILTEKQVLSRIKASREARAKIEKELERQHKEKWLQSRHRLMRNSEILLDMAGEGLIDTDRLRDVVVSLTGMFFEA